MCYHIDMQNIYATFEINKIKDKLLEYSKTELGHELINSLIMYSSVSELNNALEDLKEVSSVIIRFGQLPISNSANALFLIEMAKKTALLTPRDLSLIAEDVITSQKLLKFIRKIDVSYPRILSKIERFFDLSNLEKEIHRVISSSLTIADKATPELASIRHKLKKAESSLQDKVASLSFKYAVYLNNDNATIRDGHFVLPVKTVDKSKVLGIVYDVSDSGATTFIEPMEIVQINNEITALKVEENEECRKILKSLTSLVLLQEHEIINNNQIIADFDFLSAKALYAHEINADVAEISDKECLQLVEARHPLIEQNKVVANSFLIDKEKRIVIISGPNAGGKTVSLKTVGILVMMHQCGLALPTTKAKLSFFEHIYIDIGDNQSLSDNLSTFSAHMSHISEILSVTKGKDLVLLDELGTGTDPKEGEALALSIVKYLESKHVFAMISSHFDALKQYAFVSPNLENSSMVFNEEKLIPTYRFRLGSTGHSYGLDVASRYGIPLSVVKEAKAFLATSKQNDTSELISILEKKIEDATNMSMELEKTKRILEHREKQLIKDEEIIKNRREFLLKDVEEEKRQIIEEAQEKIDELMAKINNKELKLHEVIEIKKEINDLKDKPENIVYNEKITLNDYVSVPSFGISGRVKRIQGEKAHIVGDNGLSFDVDINKLHIINEPKKYVKQRGGVGFDQIIQLDVGLELNIIGLRAEEGKEKLIKYIDSCRIKRYSQVRIIHGFGSGILRRMTMDYLSTQKDITYRPGQMNEGGGGATVVIFKK